MVSGSPCNTIFLPNPRVADREPIRCAKFVTRFFMSYELVALGAISHQAFHLGKPCTTTFDVGVSKEAGIDSSQHFEEQSASE